MNTIIPANIKHWGTDQIAHTKQRAQDFYECAPPLRVLIGRVYRSVFFLVSLNVYFKTAHYLNMPIKDTPDPRLIFAAINYLSLILWGVTGKNDIPSLPNEWRIRKLAQDQTKKDVVLYCVPKYGDWNGCATNIHSQELQDLKTLNKTHSIVHKEVSNIEDINIAIDEITKRGQTVNTLWINAHGTSNSIDLGFRSVVGEESTTKGLQGRIFPSPCIRSLNFSQLSPNADIVLNSCSVGEKNENSMNFAEWVQIYAGANRKVYAPNEAGVSAELVETASENKFRLYTIERSIYNLLTLNFKKFLFEKKDITADISYDSAINKARHLGHTI